jgi:hypothetical protein
MSQGNENNARHDVILVSGDLFVASQLTAVTKMMGLELRQHLTGELTADKIATCRLAVIDLTSPAAASIERLVGQFRGAGLQVLAFGPHVQADRLQRARRAGCDRVVTRGAVIGEVRAALTRA